jgi:hypothetical protein
MKKIFALFPVLALLAAGCHAQVPSNPTVYSCPAVTTGTWTAQETGATEITGTAVSITPTTPGPNCYTVESINNTYTPIAASIPSNVVLVTTSTADPVASLTWTAPTSSPVPITGYIVYQIAAVQSTILAPTAESGNAIAQLDQPALTDPNAAPQLALAAPMQLVGRIEKRGDARR